MRMLYKYPQRRLSLRRPAWPRTAGARRPTARRSEYELVDTGVFDEDRYFDVEVEYAKRGPGDILIRITATNRGPEAHRLCLLPTLWFRNTWSWRRGTPKPQLAQVADGVIEAVHPRARHRAAGLPRRRHTCCSARTRPTPRGSSAATGPPSPRTASTTT